MTMGVYMTEPVNPKSITKIELAELLAALRVHLKQKGDTVGLELLWNAIEQVDP